MRFTTVGKLLGCMAVPAVCVALACCSSAQANILAADNFDYADGSLVPNGGWANHSGTAGTLLVSSGQAVVEHGVPSEDANISFSSVSGDLYYGLDFSVDSITSPTFGTDNEYFAHFREGFNFSARLDVVGPTGGGDFSVGIASDQSTADAIWPTDLSFDTVYRAVVRYNQDDNIAELWIDAALESDTSLMGEDRTDPGDTVISFALRQSDSDNNETVRVDGVVVGTTFGDVVNPVPEPTTIVLMAMAVVGLVGLRRRAV